MFEGVSFGPVAAAFGLGYLAGSIPFGLLLTQMAGLGDVRKIGSGNIGATNVLRTGRKGLAFATLLADALKGTLPVIAGSYLAGTEGAVVAGLGAFLGHLFPVWLGFKGGKGVATYIGVLAGIFWPAVLIVAAVWIAMAWFFRYSSLASLTSVVVVPPALIGFDRPAEATLFLILGLLVWAKHHGNIRRLLAGTESRIGAPKS